MSKNTVLSDVEEYRWLWMESYAMYHKIDFVSANMHQCFGNMAVILAAD